MSRLTLSRRAVAAALLLALPLAAGCGGVESSVSGAVTFDGQPLRAGSVTFAPADGVGPVAGGPVTDGKYEVHGLTPGPKVVTVDAGVAPADGPVSSGDAYEKGAKAATAPAIPPNATGNGMKVEVKPGAQTHDVALTSPARR